LDQITQGINRLIKKHKCCYLGNLFSFFTCMIKVAGSNGNNCSAVGKITLQPQQQKKENQIFYKWC
jgi:hypothetical protein